MVTDEIKNFTEDGILLMGSEELAADIIITATGFNLSILGDIDFAIDGKPLDLADTRLLSDKCARVSRLSAASGARQVKGVIRMGLELNGLALESDVIM